MLRIISLDQVKDRPVGGKAAGLAKLIALGLNVPEGFVILGASPGEATTQLEEAWLALGGGPVAVRSSALDEDGTETSFAGQYDTFLNVNGAADLHRAVEACLESANATTATVYRDRHAHQTEEEGGSMCVVVQKMVEARAAGVCFSVDPVSSRTDLLVVDAVNGLGESLVSGSASPDHHVLNRTTGQWLPPELAGTTPVLAATEWSAIAQGALEAEEKLNEPLDLEWAIDQKGTLFWLQARPVTALGRDPRELDTGLPVSGDVLTRCNVGEMMPGAVSPLTFSTCARGIEMGWQDNAIQLGVQTERIQRSSYIVMFLGHLFINLSEGARFSASVTGAPADQQSLAICGRVVPEVLSPPSAPWSERLPRIARQLKQTFGVNRNLKEMNRLASQSIAQGANSKATWETIDLALENLYEAYALHLQVSTGAGALAPIFLSILAGNGEPSQEDHATLAGFLAGAEDVESADIVAGLERVADLIASDERGSSDFIERDEKSRTQWLLGSQSGEAGVAFRAYLATHGHRSVRELDVRQPEWREEPLPVVQSLSHQVLRRASGGPLQSVPQRSAPPALARELNGRERFVSFFVPLAHRAVRNREKAKSLLVATTVQFKRAYRALGDQLVNEGRLPDRDAIFFLLHDEIGDLVDGASLAEVAVERRKALAYHETLDFADIQVGIPEPEPRSQTFTSADPNRVVGKPVSRGSVEGKARVVESLEEAQSIQAGEILVARITDVGWTPFFGVIAGLVTDLGSAVSHGAVVAREYGLPAVLNTRIGTRAVATGDLIRVDGDRGIVEILQRKDSSSPE